MQTAKHTRNAEDFIIFCKCQFEFSAMTKECEPFTAKYEWRFPKTLHSPIPLYYSTCLQIIYYRLTLTLLHHSILFQVCCRYY